MLSDRNFITSVQDYRVEPLHLDYTQDKVGVPKIKKVGIDEKLLL